MTVRRLLTSRGANRENIGKSRSQNQAWPAHTSFQAAKLRKEVQIDKPNRVPAHDANVGIADDGVYRFNWACPAGYTLDSKSVKFPPDCVSNGTDSPRP